MTKKDSTLGSVGLGDPGPEEIASLDALRVQVVRACRSKGLACELSDELLYRAMSGTLDPGLREEVRDLAGDVYEAQEAELAANVSALIAGSETSPTPLRLGVSEVLAERGTTTAFSEEVLYAAIGGCLNTEDQARVEAIAESELAALRSDLAADVSSLLKRARPSTAAVSEDTASTIGTAVRRDQGPLGVGVDRAEQDPVGAANKEHQSPAGNVIPFRRWLRGQVVPVVSALAASIIVLSVGRVWLQDEGSGIRAIGNRGPEVSVEFSPSTRSVGPLHCPGCGLGSFPGAFELVLKPQVLGSESATLTYHLDGEEGPVSESIDFADGRYWAAKTGWNPRRPITVTLPERENLVVVVPIATGSDAVP